MKLLGMTGYAADSGSDGVWEWQMEIKGYNSKNLELNIKVYGEFSFLEVYLRKYLGEYLKRGKVYFFLKLINLEEKEYEMFFNEKLLGMVKESLEKMASILEQPVSFAYRDALSVPDLIKFLPRQEIVEEEVWEFIKPHLNKLVERFLKFQAREGEEAVSNMEAMVAEMERSLSKVEEEVKTEPLRIKEKLENLLRLLEEEKRVSKDRLEEELALRLTHLDINEEIYRLRAHLKELKKILTYNEKEVDPSLLTYARNYQPVGLKLDFLCQEILREANTINSKSEKLEIIKEALKIKNEVTKLREQARNIK